MQSNNEYICLRFGIIDVTVNRGYPAGLNTIGRIQDNLWSKIIRHIESLTIDDCKLIDQNQNDKFNGNDILC